MVGRMISGCNRYALAIPVMAAFLLAMMLAPAQAARLKDIAQLDGVRENQLIGFGLVGGLAGTGDDPKSAPYAAEAIANMLGTWGFNYDPAQINVKNFAAVMVTGDLPAYKRGGDRMDVTVSSIGSAKSLEGGVLYPALLKGADQQVYAVAQGQVSLGGEVGGGGGGGGRKQHSTVGRVPEGALVENTVPSTVLKSDSTIRYNLQQPDFSTAASIVETINALLGTPLAFAADAGTVAVAVPSEYQYNLVPFIARLENLQITPNGLAKVVVNQRTGTIVMGDEVTIMPVSITHNGMSLTFGMEQPKQQAGPREEPEYDDTVPLGPLGIPQGQSEGFIPDATAPGAGDIAAGEMEEEAASPVTTLDTLGPTTAAEVSEALNKMNLSSGDIVAIFEAINAAGALLGDLEVI